MSNALAYPRRAALLLASVLCIASCAAPGRHVATIGKTATTTSRPAQQPEFTFALTVRPAARGALTFTVRLTSHAATTWLIPTPMEQGPGASYTLAVVDQTTGDDRATGKAAAPPFFADAHLPPGPPHLTPLRPGASLETTFTDTPQHLGMLPDHTYKATATYRGLVATLGQGQYRVLSAVRGEISSPAVLVVVS